MQLILSVTFLQDIDAAYIFDDNCDLDASLSALLEVPSLNMDQLDSMTPRATGQTHASGQAGSQLTIGRVRSPNIWPGFHFHCIKALCLGGGPGWQGRGGG